MKAKLFHLWEISVVYNAIISHRVSPRTVMAFPGEAEVSDVIFGRL